MQLPHGTWPSPLDPPAMARGAVRLGLPDVHADGRLTWLEVRPSEGARRVLIERVGAVTRALTPPELSPTSAVYSYGARAHAFDRAGRAVVVSAGGSALHTLDPGATPLADTSPFLVAEPLCDPLRPRLIAVGEHPRAGAEPEHGLVTIDGATGATAWLVRGRDFYASPALSPDGRSLAFLAWDHPTMSWDAAELWRAELADDGTVTSLAHVGGGHRGSAFQPTWSPDGALYAALEVGDRWALHRFDAAGPVCVAALPDAELGAPLWSLGTRLFGFADANTVVASWCAAGRSRVTRIHLSSGRIESLGPPRDHVGELACRGTDVLLVEGWAQRGSRLVHLDLATGRETVVVDALAGTLAPEDVSPAEAVTFPTSDGDTCHGFFYAPRRAGISAAPADRPPLVVVAHGGPTGAAIPNPQLAIQFFTTRGFAVLDVDYRGSTGYGRAYREKLRGRWGEADVADCAAGARWLAEAGRVDARRLAIRGASAGGLTVLLALADHRVFHAGICHYGPTDPRTMLTTTHKLESHYDRALFGTGEAYEQNLDARAALRKAHEITVPVLLFQGADDVAVPLAQTTRMADALRALGRDVELVVYPGEGHGYARAETIVDAWTRELAFLRRTLGLP